LKNLYHGEPLVAMFNELADEATAHPTSLNLKSLAG
jgi:hypothetical protein